MNPIPLPTDNIYKFIALTGVTLLVLPWILFINFSNVLQNNLSDYDKNKAVIQSDGSIFNLQTGSLELYMDDIRDQVENGKHTEESIKKLQDDLNNFISDYSDVRSEVAEYQTKVISNELLSSEIESQLKSKNFLLTSACFVSLIGLFMSFIGFTLWYFRLQRYQDLLLEKELKSKVKMPEVLSKFVRFPTIVGFMVGAVIGYILNVILDLSSR